MNLPEAVAAVLVFVIVTVPVMSMWVDALHGLQRVEQTEEAVDCADWAAEMWTSGKSPIVSQPDDCVLEVVNDEPTDAGHIRVVSSGQQVDLWIPQ